MSWPSSSSVQAQSLQTQTRPFITQARPTWFRFNKRLALAHAVGSTGGAASPFLSGLLTPSLGNAIGWRNALRVYAAVNCGVLLVAALLITPPPPSPLTEEEEDDIKVIKAEAIMADAATVPNPLKAAPTRDAQFPELMQLLRRHPPLQVRGGRGEGGRAWRHYIYK